MTQEHSSSPQVEIKEIKRIHDPERIAELFIPSNHLSDETKQKLIEMIANTGAIVEVSYEGGDNLCEGHLREQIIEKLDYEVE